MGENKEKKTETAAEAEKAAKTGTRTAKTGTRTEKTGTKASGEGTKASKTGTSVGKAKAQAGRKTEPKEGGEKKPGAAAGNAGKKYVVIADIVAKRRQIWNERHDIEYDKQYIRAAARKILSDEGLRAEVYEKPYLLIESTFYIVDKERKTVPFFLNDVQKDFVEKLETLGTGKPFFVLKGRQQGFTSLITAIQLSYAIVRKNFAGFTIADRSDNTAAIFNDKGRVVLDRLPEELRPSEKFNSQKELFFDRLNSSWRIATATADVGRSRTLNFVHFSEVAFYECDLSALQAGIGEAITAGAVQIYESTANGFNQAKVLWDSGACHNLFYEWWRSPEYRSFDHSNLESGDRWIKARLKLLEELGCDEDQRAWYANKYASYIDKTLIRQEYPISPEEAFIFSGDCVFDMEALTEQMARAASVKPVKVGYFEYKKTCAPVYSSSGEQIDVEWQISDIEFHESRDGYITIHEEPRVKTDREGNVTAKAPYTLGGDTAGTGLDYFTAKVICNLDGRTAATLRKQKIDDDLYAEQLYCLGKYYHDALIGVEINYSREPVRVLAKKYRYPNLYLREKLDRITDQTQMDYGFETTVKTKPIIISELVQVMRADPGCEVDVQTLREMTTFVRKENGKTEAIDGAHDDLVMALAIAHFVSHKQAADWMQIPSEEDKFLRDNFNFETDPGDNSGFMTWEDF